MNKPRHYEAIDSEGAFIEYRMSTTGKLEQNTSKKRPLWEELEWHDFVASTLTPSELRALALVKEHPYG